MPSAPGAASWLSKSALARGRKCLARRDLQTHRERNILDAAAQSAALDLANPRYSKELVLQDPAGTEGKTTSSSLVITLTIGIEVAVVAERSFIDQLTIRIDRGGNDIAFQESAILCSALVATFTAHRGFVSIAAVDVKADFLVVGRPGQHTSSSAGLVVSWRSARRPTSRTQILLSLPSGLPRSDEKAIWLPSWL